MNLIFATTNKRKVEDLKNVINYYNLDINVFSLTDICWDRGDIEENGKTLEENSLIKARAVYDFLKDKNIEKKYIILSDDAGLFVDALNGEPGIFTARYADDELKLNPELPKYQCLIKLLNKMNNIEKRDAYYQCVVTCMFDENDFFQESDITEGYIAKKINTPIKKPYFYSLFMLKNDKPFNSLDLSNFEELKDTYRYKALVKSLKRVEERSRNED